MARPSFAAQYARPMAAQGLDSYRYAGPYGGIAIGALSTRQALSEAQRSLCAGGVPDAGLLERWNGEAWESVITPAYKRGAAQARTCRRYEARGTIIGAHNPYLSAAKRADWQAGFHVTYYGAGK